MRQMKNCRLIEASAGTGKTQALGNRLVELLRCGVKPHEIVALTFSRAAAGEIFERFVSLLANGASTDHGDAQMLRSVLSTQHLSQIGTLDSFLMRMVRAFPLELGLVGDIEMMDDYEAASSRSEVSFSILRRTDPAIKKSFSAAFSLAMNRADVRSFAESYRQFVSLWHERVTALPSKSAWGDPVAIWGRDPAFAHVSERELAYAADALDGMFDGRPWAELVTWIREFRGSFGVPKGIIKKLLDDESVFKGDAIEFTYSRRKYSLSRGQTLRVRDALICVYGYVVRMKLELARGVYGLIAAFEKAYDIKVRRAGRLVFADVPRLVASLPEDRRMALEYRMDSRISAWALDEFQDTSREQWKALKNLLDEAKQPGSGKSVFVVGDCKQAIYGWRNGDVRIFSGERDSGRYDLGELRKTYRSGPAIVDAVNRVFERGRINSEFPVWKCPEHETAKPDIAGFVRVEESPGRKMNDFVEPVLVALKAAVGEKASDPRRRTLSAAVLVRSNKFGALLARALRAHGLEGVVWEGESAMLDTPALSGFLDLVQLADHPGDALAYRHFALTPLAAAMYHDAIPSASEISREMSIAFTTRGIVRTFRALRALLPEDPNVAWSHFTEERFTDMLRTAAEFELGMSPGTRLADFASFLAAKKKRTVAEDGKIKIMTIHRSKGLGFDYVVLPLYEKDSLCASPNGPLVGDSWILPDPGARVADAVGGLEEACALRRNRAEQEALCTYYVAMTRAKRAMTIVLHPQGESLRFSDLVRSAELGNLAHPEVQLVAEELSGNVAKKSPPAKYKRGPRITVRRRLPSQGFREGMSAGELFVRGAGRSAALARGVEAHAYYEKIEWIDAASAKNDFERAFVRPDGFVSLWRERAFEVFADGAWTSGRFDRVVFFRDAGGLSAVVLDFKTNRPTRGESEGSFAVRMRAEYAGQMRAYCAAVAALSGIPRERIAARLCLSETGTVCDVIPFG